ncbi:MAG: hypothetical protein OXR73_11445 [Myxococcales bacterium]|nr:hypothetical protein [Myxococcales bacterium]
MSRSLDELLDLAVEVAGRCQARSMLIGGCARNAYAAPRATRDVDLAVEVSEARYGELVAEMGHHGFCESTVVNECDEPVPDVLLLNDGDGGRVDLLFAKTDFEREALSRRVPLEGHSGGAYVATPEDLIVYKLIAGRPRDIADIHEVVSARERAGFVVDWAHVERWAREWDLLPRLQQLRTQLSKTPG